MSLSSLSGLSGRFAIRHQFALATLLAGLLLPGCGLLPESLSDQQQQTTGSVSEPIATPTPAPAPAPTSVPTGTLAIQSAEVVNRPGWFLIGADASANISRVELYRNGSLVGEDATAGFDFRVPYTASAASVDRFEVRGFDSAGNRIATAVRDVTLQIGRVLYVCGCGSDSASGLSEAAPRQTLQSIHSLTQPGDSVLVMAGTYSNGNPNANILSITRSGTPSQWIAWIGYPGQQHLIKARNWNAIAVEGAAYILIEGLTLEGNRAEVTLAEAQANTTNLNNPITSGNGINIRSSYTNTSQLSRFVTVRGNTVRDFPGGGIGSNRADHVVIEDNVVLRNGWYAPYGNSGISIYQAWQSDSVTGVKNIIRRNISSGNANFIPFFAVGSVTDGNGIIIDDSRNTQLNSTLGAYRGRTLVENNIVYANGGRGLNVYQSDHVDLVNNSSYRNATHPEISSEMAIVDASDIRVVNNIVSAGPDKPAWRTARVSGLVTTNNLFFGGTGLPPAGSISGDPRFANAGQGDFRLLAGSPAIDAGTTAGAPATDLLLVKRPRGAGIDLGAYEGF